MHGTGKRESPEVFICFLLQNERISAICQRKFALENAYDFFRREKAISFDK
jgi:hypothetical protein